MKWAFSSGALGSAHWERTCVLGQVSQSATKHTQWCQSRQEVLGRGLRDKATWLRPQVAGDSIR